MSEQREAQLPPTYSRFELISLVGVIGALALLLGLFAVFRPTEVADKRSIAYTNVGKFDYAAETRGDSPYGSGGLSAGEPIITDKLGPVTVTFDYELKGRRLEAVHGSAAMTATVELPQGLSRELIITERKAFDGTEARVTGTLPVKEIRRFVQSAQSSFGSTGYTSATVTVQAAVRARGSVAGKPLNTKFAPTLPFALEGSTLTLSQSADSLSGSGEQAHEVLSPKKKGKVEYDVRVANTVPLLIAEPTVSVARGLGFGIAGLCLIAGLWLARPLLRNGHANQQTRIRTLYGAHLVEVTDLSLRGGPVARLASMDALVDLAKKYESKIMHVPSSGEDVYCVWDNGMLYEYRASIATPPETARVADAEGADPHSGDGKHVNGAKFEAYSPRR